ncbi:helix-turn-helix transcriptional regulator [Micromonospora sp. WMMD712]|uniref:helix-turn-helix domain-containing protein n=1 Tax=Micromonospora sp. WMMD712 TaxID=3016096 RepID=UPI00249ADC93|nr:helix-turn-helix transcriptional regulator [Micromonospora sp. WMMD712]WFE60886.1 helix-turn-helix transcriptional regulator [Micromonospora sp. WMMD712]
MTNDDLPIGRRMARLRSRRHMTQQMLADRLGKSKSWVDKVERGVRTLDRFSVIAEVATVLCVDPTLLLGRDTPPPTGGGSVAAGIDAVRAALARYDTDPDHPAATPTGDLGARVGHAWLAYEHADYPGLLRALPGLLGDAQLAHAATGSGKTASLLVQAYRIAASVLVKLGQADLGWFAADRAMAVASSDPALSASAVVPIGQALRALGCARLALAATVPAMHRITAARPPGDTPGLLLLRGALLVEAARAAAACGDADGVRELLDQATSIASEVGNGGGPYRVGFCPATVTLARVTTAADLGDAHQAVTRHAEVVALGQWLRLPVEHRAAYLLDVARAHLLVGDLLAAGRTLIQADRTAPGEVRLRPAARTVIAELTRGAPLPADVASLATAIGLPA